MSNNKLTNKKTLFERSSEVVETEGEKCLSCDGQLVIKHSKKGSFFGCSCYPACDYTRPLVEHERMEDKVLPGSSCPKCFNLLAVKQGRYGMFIGCTNFPDCDHIEDNNPKDDSGVACPKCKKGELFEQSNRFGKIFYSCNEYPKCKYVLNYQPVNKVCPECHWPVMMIRNMVKGAVLQCPVKSCSAKVANG